MSIDNLMSDKDIKCDNTNSSETNTKKPIPDSEIECWSEKYCLKTEHYCGPICINQWMRPKFYIQNNRNDVGDCRKCMPSKDNVYCKNYYPIKITNFDVKE